MGRITRKYPAIDVVKMRATLTREKWVAVLTNCIKTGNMEKLIGWRYGMQAGLTDATEKPHGIKDLDIWVFKRIKNIETAMREILKKKHPMPTDNPLHDPRGYKVKCVAAKKARDREFAAWLLKSGF